MAVYTNIGRSALESFLTHYKTGALKSYEPVAAGINNSNYLLETDSGRYILTLIEDFSPGREALPYITALMDRLNIASLPCPRILNDKDGGKIGVLSGKPALLLSFLEGSAPAPITPAHCAALGDCLARMHKAGQNFALKRPNPWSLPRLLQRKDDYLSYAEKFAPGLSKKLIPVIAHLQKKWPDNLPAGHIHADLFPDNTLFQGERLTGIIDFYLAGEDFLAYDLAICVNAWCFDDEKTFNTEKYTALLNAYQAVLPLTDADKKSLQILHQGAALRFLMSRLAEQFNRPQEALVTPHDPHEYLQKLDYHLENDIRRETEAA
jgi:homoserine kinase type II